MFGIRKSGRKIDIRRAFVRSGGSDVRCSDQERNGFLIDTDLLEPGEREVRNPRIVLAFRRIGLSEHAGWGLRDVFRNWQQLGHVPPLILSDRRRRSFEMVLNKKALLSERQLLFQRKPTSAAMRFRRPPPRPRIVATPRLRSRPRRETVQAVCDRCDSMDAGRQLNVRDFRRSSPGRRIVDHRQPDRTSACSGYRYTD